MNRIRSGALAVLASAACLGSMGALLHHGWSEYDATRTLNLTGTVSNVRFTNPHVIVDLRTAGENAKTWRAVLAPPSRMTTRGLPSSELRDGMTARVVGYPHRRDPVEMRAERIIIANDTTELR